ncbi:Mth938-like domain-containing protein [Sphingoaurantiacus capsulatus]|uniref:Mth938-like domain-containing protein n=1 Tax=Sphingoaurantiacus capsulatus TaxID=1771310 RepID=A0ABV7XCQ8_9SPHN
MPPRFEQQAPAGSAPVIQGYAAGGFRVSGQHYAGGVLVTPTRAIDWPVTTLDDLTADSFAPLGDEPVEVILLGTGATMRRPAKDVMEAFVARGLVVELMDSKAAARTYTMLAGEGRLVVAALLPL